MSNKFKQRSTQSEILDSPGIPEPLLIRNLREMDFLNHTTGGFSISLEGIKMLLNDKKDRTFHIADLGCGSGGSLKYLARWARKNGIRAKFSGIDKNQMAINYLKKKCAGFPEIKGYALEYTDYLKQKTPVDIIHCSLFCHHLPDEELVQLIQKMKSVARVGFVINDLQRNRRAYYSALIMTYLLGGTKLAKHDGPVSVLRGFKKNELDLFMKKGGVKNYIIYRRRGFRFLVVAGNSKKNLSIFKKIFL